MQINEKLIRYPLGVLHVLVSTNAFGGGYYGMMGAKDLPQDWLVGTPFKNYLIPSLFLFFVIGGSFLFTSIAVFRKFRTARLLSICCGLLLIAWLVIQISIIGYVSWMQPVTLGAAILILILAALLPTTKIVKT